MAARFTILNAETKMDRAAGAGGGEAPLGSQFAGAGFTEHMEQHGVSIPEGGKSTPATSLWNGYGVG